MAFMGASIAMSFALSMVLGPTKVPIPYFGLPFLALISIVILIAKVPTPPRIKHENTKKITNKYTIT